MKDVAKRLGVSPSTVSRVISNDPRISEETARRVRSAMKEMGFHPNLTARSLVSQSTRMIGLIMHRTTSEAMMNPFFPEAIAGISQAAAADHYDLLISTEDGVDSARARSLSLLRHGRVDGLILLASKVEDPVIAALHQDGFPFLVIGRVAEALDVPTINNDNVQAAREAVWHLIALGHRRIAFIRGSADLVVTVDRQRGYEDTLREHGIEPSAEWVAHTDFSIAAGSSAAHRILQLRPRPTAVFAADDLLAFGAMQAIKALGLRIPQDVALIGFNDNPAATCVEPPLSSLRIPIREMGRLAATTLIQQIQGRRVPMQQILPATLIVRESCGSQLGTTGHKERPAQ